MRDTNCILSSGVEGLSQSDAGAMTQISHATETRCDVTDDVVVPDRQVLVRRISEMQ